jgi:uncharacterized damage-inducible protein DinB
MPENIKLELSVDLHPRLALLLAQMDDVRRNLKKQADGVGREALESRPVAEFLTPGCLLAHIAEAEAWWVGVVLRNAGDPEKPQQLPSGWCKPFAENDDGEPIAEGQAPEAYIALLDAVRADTRSALARLSAEDLARDFDYRGRDGKDYVFSLEWVLHHLVEHEAHHRGQFALLKRLT